MPSLVRVHASSISAAVPPLPAGSRGQVHSVFARALNVSLGSALVAIVAEDAGRLPNGVSVRAAPDFRGLGIVPGDGVVLCVDVAGATIWDPTLPLDHVPIPRERVRHLAGLLPAGGLGTEAEDPWQAWPSIRVLRRGLAAHDLDRSLVAAAELVGRGPGLTPAGDDLLVGCSAALRVAGHPLGAAFAAGVAAAVPGRTTDVAAAFHACAARGAYAEHLHDVVLAVDDDALAGAVERALAWGATSGADAMLGVVIGLEAAA
ncbi:MAG: DUF2877 domain-containing protein [Candidatus Limnocylindrales bacterium]